MFSPDTSLRDLNNMIETTTTKGSFQLNTQNRLGTIAEYDFGRIIGTDIKGNPTSRLRVVISPLHEVTTAFPY